MKPENTPAIHSPSQGTQSAPEEVHHFYYARFRAAIFLLMYLPFGGYMLAGFFGIIIFLNAPKLAWAYVVLVPIYLWGAWRIARKLWWREPMLTLDSQGITDYADNGRFIPWRSIRKLYIGPYGASSSLLIAFQGKQSMESALGGPQFLDRKLVAIKNMINAPGATWGIALGPLSCRTGQVLKLAERLHATAMGREPQKQD